MRWSSRLKLTKYWAKSRVLALSPSFYWKTRRLLRGIWEEEIRLIPWLARSDALAIDVGAHFGMYTHELAQHARAVHAFEPIPELGLVLKRGYARHPSVTVHTVALSDAQGTATLRVPRAGWGRSTIEAANELSGRRDPTAPIDSVEVEMRTLDSYDFHDVSFCKIDVEGHEATVLRGALQTLARERPALLIEMETRHRPDCMEATRALLEPLGYRSWRYEGNALTEVKDAATGPSGHNYLFLGEHDLARLRERGLTIR